MNSEDEERDMKELEERERKRKIDRQQNNSIDIFGFDENQQLMNQTRQPERDTPEQVEEYFFVYTDEGPVRCKRYVSRNVSQDLLQSSDDLDSTLFYLEQENDHY